MKKLYAVFLAVAVLVTPIAQAKSCVLNGCDYILNGTFYQSGLYWSSGGGNGVTYPTSTTCSSTNRMAHLDNSEWISQSFYVDDTYVEFSMNFDLYHPNDTDNWYDQLKVTVTNDDTNVSETFYWRGSSFTTSCSNPMQNIQLQNDYSNANVTVRFDVAYLATGQFDIDNVGFWGFQ